MAFHATLYMYFVVFILGRWVHPWGLGRQNREIQTSPIQVAIIIELSIKCTIFICFRPNVNGMK